jgi:hypothetical protein
MKTAIIYAQKSRKSLFVFCRQEEDGMRQKAGNQAKLYTQFRRKLYAFGPALTQLPQLG